MGSANPIHLVQHTIPNLIQSKLAFIATDPLPWKESVLTFSWIVWGFESYLLYRQFPNYSKPQPPTELLSFFPDDKFQQGQKYGASKAKFSAFSLLYSQILETALIVFDVYARSWDAATVVMSKLGYSSDYEIATSLVWAVLLFVSMQIPVIPLSYYQTFVLEEQYGFNKTTKGLFVADLFKGWALGGAIGLPFLALFLSIIKWAGSSFIPYLMAFIITSQLILVIVYPLLIQPLFNKLSPLPEGTLRTRIEALASSLNFPLKHLYVIDGSKRSSHSNAYFYGLPWSKHIVIFDTLIAKTSEEQIEAVLGSYSNPRRASPSLGLTKTNLSTIAHELGHWKYSHPSKMLVVSQLYLASILSVFPPFLRSSPLLRSFGFNSTVAAHPPILVAFMLFQMVQGPIDAMIKVGMNALSRHYEYEADRFACELDDRAAKEAAHVHGDVLSMSERLGQALISLHVGNLSTVWVDWLFSTWHHSHPTLTERLKAMETIRNQSKATAASQGKKEL
ncbi:hypothetical protein FRC04_004131 [Tulasnella sp. 424]|nr:hypothetical protein FRC04_004131 [Tulasnella sp. 424]